MQMNQAQTVVSINHLLTVLILKGVKMKCEGDCTPHIGKVQHVYSGKNPKTGERWDWWYCQEAIKEDKLRGFEVVDVKTGNIL